MHTFPGRIGRMIRQKRSIPFALMLVAAACTAAMLVTYALTGVNTFTPVLSEKVMALESVCAVLCVLLALFEIKNAKYGLYLISLWAWLEYLFYNASYMSNVVVGIDGNQFSVGFLLTVIFGLLAWGCTLFSAILQKQELGWHMAAEGKEA
ncbi:MAG: hypothetical protein ACI4ME_10890 [Aristaeellaceae bacterium]